MSYKLQQTFFVLRFRYLHGFSRSFRKLWLGFLGMKTGSGTQLPPLFITWPHQVSIGKECKLESHIHFKFDGTWKPGPNIKIGDRVFIGMGCEFNIKESISIGNDCLLASGCRFVDHDHSTAPGKLMREQICTESKIIVGNDVWIGANAVILKGVHIEDGAVIAAGAVVNKSIPVNEIWAGIPAKKIGNR